MRANGSRELRNATYKKQGYNLNAINDGGEFELLGHLPS
jgi:hypothetical protein